MFVVRREVFPIACFVLSLFCGHGSVDFLFSRPTSPARISVNKGLEW